jgi:hypothetical protein
MNLKFFMEALRHEVFHGGVIGLGIFSGGYVNPRGLCLNESHSSSP